MSNVKYEGVKVELTGREYILPPLPISKMPKVKALMDGGEVSDEFVGSLLNAIHWSLLRNYPALEFSVVEDSIDLKNWQGILGAFMQVNGFAKGEKVGEAQAPSLT